MKKMLITGSRTLEPTAEFINELRIMIGKIDGAYEVVSGGAKGVDASAEEFAKFMGWKLTVFPADWNKHGKAAGPIRNKQMAEYSDFLLLIWDGQSRGSSNMKEEMKKQLKPIYEVVLKS